MGCVCVDRAHAAVDEDMVLKGKRLSFYSPHLLNPKYFGFEFGFVVNKKIESWDYPYYAYAKATVVEEFYTSDQGLRAGALGVKAGLLLPTQPWVPVFLDLGFGFAKTAYQKDPWFGSRDKTIKEGQMYLAEIGLVMRLSEKLLLRTHIQVNNLDYFKRDFFVSIGFNY